MIDRLYHDAALARFYDLENAWGDDLAFCAGLAECATSVLDLGCGTGRFAATLKGKDVVGVDPAAAMLDVARRRPGGAAVTWVQDDARTVRLGRHFDLVVMTGHAFQCFLSNADQLAVCQTISAHLMPGGSFIFDSREPRVEEWLEWSPQRSERWIDDPELGRVRAFNDAHHNPESGIVTYGTFYVTPDGRLWQAQSQIRFRPQREIAACIAAAGLAVDRWMGDWQGGPLGEDRPEIIVIGHFAG